MKDHLRLYESQTETLPEIFKVAKDVIIEDSVETMRKAIMVLTATTIAKETDKNNEADTPEAEI